MTTITTFLPTLTLQPRERKIDLTLLQPGEKIPSYFLLNAFNSPAGRIFSANASNRGSPWSGLSNGSKRIVFKSGWRLAKDFSNQSIA
jgi:hypothetical protein